MTVSVHRRDAQHARTGYARCIERTALASPCSLLPSVRSDGSLPLGDLVAVECGVLASLAGHPLPSLPSQQAAITSTPT
jgi:hypothetical protein